MNDNREQVNENSKSSSQMIVENLEDVNERLDVITKNLERSNKKLNEFTFKGNQIVNEYGKNILYEIDESRKKYSQTLKEMTESVKNQKEKLEREGIRTFTQGLRQENEETLKQIKKTSLELKEDLKDYDTWCDELIRKALDGVKNKVLIRITLQVVISVVLTSLIIIFAKEFIKPALLSFIKLLLYLDTLKYIFGFVTFGFLVMLLVEGYLILRKFRKE